MLDFGPIGRFFPKARDRDGQARAVNALVEVPEGVEAAVGTRVGPTGPAPEGMQSLLAQTVATKLLQGWLANRHQTLAPHTLNFRALAPEQGALLVGVMAAAAQADGCVDINEQRQLPLVMERVGAGPREIDLLQRAMNEPQPLGRLLAEVHEARLSAHAYAAALLSINRSSRINQAFLDYLALRLALPADVARSLERRYRA